MRFEDRLREILANKRKVALGAKVEEFAKKGLSPARFLIQWYNEGGNGIIQWGSDGDWTRCYNKAKQYLPDEDAKGFCANRHHDALGYWPGECGKPGNPPCKEK